MNEKAERINGWAAMIGVIAAMGSYALTGDLIPGIWQNIYKVQVTQLQEVIKMLLLATCLLGAFIIGAAFKDASADDDDDMDGGMMIPAQIPV